VPVAEQASFSVMVTRPGERGKQLSEQLHKQGLPAWHLPTLKIIAEEMLLPAEDFQQAIFISPNAVNFSVEKSKTLIDMLPDQLIAVGHGTAGCLLKAGFDNVIVPQQFNSEGLLALPQLQDVKGQQILIIKGRGGRTLLAETLAQRGASCHYLDVYCRVTEQLNMDLWKAFLTSGKKNIITAASVDAVKALNSNLGKNIEYSKLILVVASQRIKETAQQYGYKEIVVADSASNDAMMRAVMGLVSVEIK